jgi:hypothetical protein
MTAAEARKRAEEIKQTEINSQMACVMEDIEVAIKNGHMSTTYYKPLTQEIIDFLEREPNLFKIIKQNDWREGNYYEISW